MSGRLNKAKKFYSSTEKSSLKVQDPISLVRTMVKELQNSMNKVIISTSKIPKYHKIALNDIPQGASIIKNGICIGKAKKDIDMEAHIHVHNISSNRAVL